MGGEWRIDPEAWPEAVADTDGPQLVVAGPGTGKTEFLVRRALHLINAADVPPEKLLLLSFSRRSAADLRSRVEAGLDRSFAEVAASTFHSLAYRLLETYALEAFGWWEMPTLLTSPEHVELISQLLGEERRRDWPVLLRTLLTTRTFAEEVADFVLRCREQLIEPNELAERAEHRTLWRALPGFLVRYSETLKAQHRIDYGTLQAQAVRLLEDQAVVESLTERFGYILVDEYQDTTVAQARILERLYRPHRNLTVAGDPYQSIYSFRGTELGNVEDFRRRFTHADGVPARRLVLTTSFRVPAEILAAAERVTAAGALPGAAGVVAPAPGRGSVETYGFNQQSHEAEWIASELQRIHLTEAVPYRAMAVLVRSKRHFLQELSRALDRRRIPHDRPGRRLADHPAVRLVLDVVVAATSTGDDRDHAVERLLLGPLFALSLGRWRELQRLRIRGELSWPEMLRAQLPDGAPLAGLIEDAEWARLRPAADGFWHLWSTLPQLVPLATAGRNSDERQGWSSLSQVLARLRERNPGATLADYLRLTEEEEFEATPLLGFRSPQEDRLTLTTLHQAKGLEFEAVFIADAVEGVFPDLRPRASLLEARLLATSQPADRTEYARFRLQEEMRLAYTAMCRARSRVVWTATMAGPEEGQGAPSRFLAAAAATATVAAALHSPEERTDPATPLEAEAWLRRIVRDPASGEARRLAAMTLLARGPEHGLRDPDHFAGVRPAGPDRGVLPSHHTLSPSQAESYAECPRRYVLEKRLRVGDETTVYLAFGTLIHEVLETAERGAAGRGEGRSTVEEALAVLDDRFQPLDFGGPPWADAWLTRARRALEQLYAHWPPDSGRPIALEHPFEIELGGATWRGRADRIERGATGVRIVDYKTGTRMPTQERAATSLQLGFYSVATTSDPFVAAHGSVVAAEMWFLSHHRDRKSVYTRSLDLALLDEVEAELAGIAESIAAEDWEPTPGDGCDRCRVRLVCPAWPQGREAFQP